MQKISNKRLVETATVLIVLSVACVTLSWAMNLAKFGFDERNQAILSDLVAGEKDEAKEVRPDKGSLYAYEATYIKNYDGDTATFMVSCGLNVYVRLIGRLYGINTPELRGTRGKEKEKAIEAKTFLQDKLKAAKSIIIVTKKDKKGKYGRYLVTIWCDNDTASLNDQLITKGLAVEYLK